MGVRSSGNRGSSLSRTDGHLIRYYRNIFGAGASGGGITPLPIGSGIEATGGVISDYVDGQGNVYRSHVFTSSGTFQIQSIGDFGDTIEYLVVAGGGGAGAAPGSSFIAGGGGAGGLRSNMPGIVDIAGNPLSGESYPVSASPGEYSITVGGGGAGAQAANKANPGSDSTLVLVDPSQPSAIIQALTITSTGGGRGGNGIDDSGESGGSGGGGAERAQGQGSTVPGSPGNTPGTTPPQGNPGGAGNKSNAYGGGGGGGAGEPGVPSTNSFIPGGNGYVLFGGQGGDGVQVNIAGPANTGVGDTSGWFAGGGGGSRANPNAGPVQPDASLIQGFGGAGGGGRGGRPQNVSGGSGISGTGGGGGGAYVGGYGGSGGSGIVIIRYQVGQIAATARASGGAVSFYNGLTIHTFTSSGTFTVDNNEGNPLSVDHIIIAGGGGGASASTGGRGGAGGAGGVRSSIPGIMPATADSQFVVAPGPSNALTITVGGGGAGKKAPAFDQSGDNGSASTISSPNPISAPGGGGGSGNIQGLTGASGGGAGGQSQTGGLASPDVDSTRMGYPGGNSVAPSVRSSGGGGGAGGAGQNGTGTGGGHGGIGIQLPAAFRNPISAPTSTGGGLGMPGPNSQGFWFAGGGGGAADGPSGATVIGSGGGPGGPFAGAGPGTISAGDGGSGTENTGSGGGGTYIGRGGAGGSGIVIIAYPT